jgi:hypothetical protein
MSFPTTALDPNGKVVSILVTPDGKLVTDQAAKPTTVVPIQKASLILDELGRVRIA